MHRRDKKKVSVTSPEAQIALRCLIEAGFGDVSSEDLKKLRPQDEYDKEMNLAAEVTAYHRVTVKHVVDVVSSGILTHLLRDFGSRVGKRLNQDLRLYDEGSRQRSVTWLAEDPEVVGQRAELTARLQRLQKGLAAVEAFG